MSIEDVSLPHELYSCSCDNCGCAEEQSFPADMLRYWAGSEHHREGFYCIEACLDDACFDYMPEGDPETKTGTLLSEEIARRRSL